MAIQANALGSIVYGGVQTVNTVKETYGRKLKQVRIFTASPLACSHL